jgi:hypothetical protein
MGWNLSAVLTCAKLSRPPRYKVLGDSIIDRATDVKVGTLFEKNRLYKNLLEAHDVDYTQFVSKNLLPDDARRMLGYVCSIQNSTAPPQ